MAGSAITASVAPVSTRIGIASGASATTRIPAPTPHFENSSMTSFLSADFASLLMTAPFVALTQRTRWSPRL